MHAISVAKILGHQKPDSGIEKAKAVTNPKYNSQGIKIGVTITIHGVISAIRNPMKNTTRLKAPIKNE